MRAGAFPRNRSIRLWAGALAVLCVLGLLQVFFNQWLGMFVVIYGIRCYCLHVPLIFVMAEVFRKEDLLRIGRWTLLLTGPMALLMVAQFFSPPDSILNRGIAGEGIGQITTAFGRIRPAGTFSYGTGATSFNLLAAVFLIYSFVDTGWVSVRVRGIAAFALIVVMPISGSRGFVLSLGLLLLFAVVAGTLDRRLLRVTLKVTAIGVGVFFLLTLTSFFREGVLTFTTRWQVALGASGSVNDAIVQRFFGEFIHAFEDLGEAPLLGYGLGLASNVGAALTVRSLGFLLAETEWEKTVMEMGPIVAVFWLGARSAFGMALYRWSWASLRRGIVLPWLLLGTECLGIFNGLLEQTTSLGFLIFTTGLCMAAIRSGEEGDSTPAADGTAVENTRAVPQMA